MLFRKFSLGFALFFLIQSALGATPSIEIRTYSASLVRMSRSKRVYLFNFKANPSQTSALPSEGRILLLKKGKTSILGMRVLKQYESENQFAAKVLRTYSSSPLELDQWVRVLEKTGNATPNLSASDEDQADLKELEENDESDDPLNNPDPPVDAPNEDDSEALEIESDDSNDGEITPGTPLDTLDAEEGETDAVTPDEEAEVNALSIQEVFPLDTQLFGTSLEFGFLKNGTASGGSANYMALGLRQSITPLRAVFVRDLKMQDTLSLELGLFSYSVNYFVSQTTADQYQVVPIHGAVRYNLMFGEIFQVFGYAGFMKNWVRSTFNASDEGIAALSTLGPAFGGGLLYRFGPNWDLRVQTGSDSLIGIGIMVRY